MPDLAAAVAAGEHAVFHGPPADALPGLDRAIEQAAAQGRAAELAILGWLRGVALGACGRYGEGLDLLEALLAVPTVTARDRLVIALVAAASASLHRQLGLHARARELDERGRQAAEPLGPSATEALLDCLVGLAADAVGLDDAQGAVAGVARAEVVAAERGDAAGWRPRCRLEWVRAETALLTGDPAAAEAAAVRALQLAEDAAAPRHQAKSLLFLGVAEATRRDDQEASTRAVTTLRRSAALAESLGALPLVWPARAVLGALLAGTDPAASREQLEEARSAVRVIAERLPPGLRDPWLARPDLAALLTGGP